jgi:hypothetical protein
MRMKKQIFVVGLLTVLFVLAPHSRGLAFEPPPEGAIIGPPELWGVVVVDCTTKMAMMRVKSIEDCNIDTQAVVVSVPACPASANELLNQQLPISILNIAKTPVITKVKNFKEENKDDGTVKWVSCDVQIKFWTTPE